jgi:hypothetical protein
LPLRNSTGDGNGALNAMAALGCFSSAASRELSEQPYLQRIGAVGAGNQKHPDFGAFATYTLPIPALLSANLLVFKDCRVKSR